MPLSTILQKILGWLQAGYPRGIPQQDYFPLLAFLARDMKTDEVCQVLSALEADQDERHRTTSDDVQVAIERVTSSPALNKDVQRVEKRLRDAGWDL